jgi:hypothetical protein
VRAWRDLVDDATSRLGLVSPALVRHWRAELDEVERRVALLECAAPVDSAGGGLHAFVVLASARIADAWDPAQLIDAATAVELAHRASQHHRRVVDVAVDSTAVDSTEGADGERCPNARVVLDGDWSITQAAVLVAGIGPAAYRCLVRGYGLTQVGQIFGDSEPLALMQAAVDLAALVAGLPSEAAHSLWAGATSGGPLVVGRPTVGAGAPSLPAAVVAWAIATYVSDGVMNARNVPARDRRPAPIDVQLSSRSTTTSPAVGRS